MELTHAEWKKSSRSGANGNCVEVASNLHDVVAIRDTKDRGGPVLIVGHAAWAALVAGAKNGEFDILK